MPSATRQQAHHRKLYPIRKPAKVFAAPLFLMAASGSAFAAMAWVPPGPQIGEHSPSLYFGAALLIATAAVAAMLAKTQALIPARQHAKTAQHSQPARAAALAARERPQS